MSNELKTNEVAFKAGNRVIIGKVVDDSKNNVITLTNFRSNNGKPYGTGMPMEIRRNKLINNNVVGVAGLFNNSAFKKRSNNANAKAEQKRVEAQAFANAQNSALNGMSTMFNNPPFKEGNQVSWIGNHGNRKNRTIVGTVNKNSNNENIKVAIRNYKASNGKPLQTTNEVINITKTKLRKNENKGNMQLNSLNLNKNLINFPSSLVRNTTPKNFSKVTKTMDNSSWIKQRSNAELQSRINAARVGPKNLVNTGNNLRNGKVSSRVAMFDRPRNNTGIYHGPVNTGSTMTIAQRKAAMGLKGGKKTAPKKKPTKKPTKKATKKKVSGGRDSTSRMIPE